MPGELALITFEECIWLMIIRLSGSNPTILEKPIKSFESLTLDFLLEKTSLIFSKGNC